MHNSGFTQTLKLPEYERMFEKSLKIKVTFYSVN